MAKQSKKRKGHGGGQCDCPGCQVNRCSVDLNGILDKFCGLRQSWVITVELEEKKAALAQRLKLIDLRFRRSVYGGDKEPPPGLLDDFRAIRDDYRKLLAEWEAWVGQPANVALSDQRKQMIAEVRLLARENDLRIDRARLNGQWTRFMEGEMEILMQRGDELLAREGPRAVWRQDLMEGTEVLQREAKAKLDAWGL